MITRAFTANSETNWQNGVLATFSAIATDKIRNHKWAAAGDSNQPFKEKRLIRDLRSLKNKENGEFRTDRATKMVKMHTSPECIFLFMKQIGENIYAIRNMKNHKYFDCTITTMSDLIKDDCQRWKLIPAARGNKNEFYIQNVQNKE